MQGLKFFGWIGCIAFTLALRAQVGSPNPPVPIMRQIYVQDQRDRGVLLSDSGGDIPAGIAQQAPKSAGDKLTANDAKRRDRVRTLLASGKVITSQDFHDAAFIFQHGQSANDYLLAHILAVQAIGKGDVSSKWISAATLDRYLQAIGQKQVFGTQYGDTQEPYDDTLVSDGLRLDFCVPQLAQQKVNLQEFKQGRYPSRIVPQGCTR